MDKTPSLISKLREEDTSGNSHFVIRARAGTGKTKVAIGGLNLIGGLPLGFEPSEQQKAVLASMERSKGRRNVCMVAYNKSIATEIKPLVPPFCKTSTLHSMGYSALRDYFGPTLKVDEYRTKKIVMKHLGIEPNDYDHEDYPMIGSLTELAGFAKKHMLPLDAEDAADEQKVHDLCRELVDEYGIDVGDEDMEARIYRTLPEVLGECRQVTDTVDFDDMVYLPVALNLPVMRYDLLMVDEAQDLNIAGQCLVKRAGKRIGLAGDDRQSIYGFTGADVNSLPRMTRELGLEGKRGCELLPLTVTRRCAKRIVDEAKRYVPDFEAHPDNGEGMVLSMLALRPDLHTTPNNGDLVLCRRNGPLVRECMRMLREGRAARILGRDVAAGLVALCNRVRNRTRMNLTTYRQHFLEMVDRLIGQENEKSQPNRRRIDTLMDSRTAIVGVMDSLPGDIPYSEFLSRLHQLFSPENPTDRSSYVLFSTIHKAKGMGNPTVYYLDEPLRREVQMRMTAKEKIQEENLRYVAITRAEQTLVYVG